MPVQNYRELEVWQKAMDLVALVYRQTARFPREEMYGLRNQLRRASVSIPSNIAEGQGRRTTKEFLHHLSIARGSVLEVQTQVEIAKRLQYLTEDQAAELDRLIVMVLRLLNGLMNALDRKLESDSVHHPLPTTHRG
jgi:four helix bundle protein